NRLSVHRLHEHDSTTDTRTIQQTDTTTRQNREPHQTAQRTKATKARNIRNHARRTHNERRTSPARTLHRMDPIPNTTHNRPTTQHRYRNTPTADTTAKQAEAYRMTP